MEACGNALSSTSEVRSAATPHIGPQVGDVLVADLAGPCRHGGALAVEHRRLEPGEIVLGKLAQVEAERARADHVAPMAARAQVLVGVAALVDVALGGD